MIFKFARALFLLAFVSFQSLADVTSLVVDPLSPTTVYAGTTEGGVLKSADGGASWARAGLMDTPVITLAIDPGAPSLLYALTWAGLLKSTNGGETWTPTLMNGSDPYWMNPPGWYVGNLALARRTDPALPATVYAGVTFGWSDEYDARVWGDVYASTDGGAGWSRVLPTDWYSTWIGGLPTDPYSSPWLLAPALASAPRTDTTPATLYTSYPFREYPTAPAPYDYQVCWIRDGTLTGCARLDQSLGGPNVLVVDPRNPHVVYAGMNGSGVYKTTDAAVTWSGGGSGVVRALVLDPLTPGMLYACAFTASGSPAAAFASSCSTFV